MYMVISCACLWGQGIPPYSYYWYRVSGIAAVGTTFNVFSYDAVWVEHRTIEAESELRGRLLREAMYKGEQLFIRLIMAEHQTHNHPVQSGYATCYATNAGFVRFTIQRFFLKLNSSGASNRGALTLLVLSI